MSLFKVHQWLPVEFNINAKPLIMDLNLKAQAQAQNSSRVARGCGTRGISDPAPDLEAGSEFYEGTQMICLHMKG